MRVSKHKQLEGTFQFKRNFVGDQLRSECIPPSELAPSYRVCPVGWPIRELHVPTTCQHIPYRIGYTLV